MDGTFLNVYSENDPSIVNNISTHSFLEGKISEPPAKKVKTGHCELVSLLEEHKKNDCDSTNIFRQLLNEYNFSNNANISYEKVDILFQEFTSLCKNDVLNEEVRLFMENDMSKLFGHRSVVQYFKHNLESYCSIIALLMVKCDLDALLVFLQNENTFSKKIVTENEFYKYFLDINLPVFVSIVEKYNDPRLFNEVCEVFKSECVVQMASWQVMNLFKTFIFHLESAVGNFGGSYEESQNNFIELLCKLSSWLLRSIRMAENTVTTMVTQNFNDGMKQLKDILNKLGEALLKQEHNQTLVAAFLNLSYDWSEMYMIFHYYRGIEENSLNMHHLDYIHSFLSTEQWALLSQRITNFGESNCKTFMLKLFVQKLRTMRLFGKQMNEEIRRETIEYISYNIENNCEYIISEKFIDEHLIHELDFDLVILMAERSFKTRSSSLLPKIFSNIDKTYFFIHNEDAKEYFITLKNIYEQNLWEADEYLRSVDKIQTYLNWLKRLPIPYLSPNIQSMILLYIIIGVLQSGEVSLRYFIPGINYLLDHSDHSDNLEFSIFVLNNLLKVWKSKISKEFHVLCTEVKDLILNKHLEIVTSTKADLSIIQSYVVCLKYYMGICDDKYVSKLVDLLESFLTAILSSETHILPKGSISLFATVLNNKEALKMPSDLPLRIWKFCKTKEVSPKDVEEFSQVICSVYEHIPNEEFENIVEDLWIMIEEPIQKEDFSLMSKQLGIWSYILTSSFNPVKVKIWHKALEKLLFNLSLLKNRMQFSQQVFDEIMDFEIAVIRHNQLSISSTIMGIFLMSPVIVLQKSDSFYDKFHKCSDYIECLLKYRNSLIMDRLPTFLRLFRLLLSNLCEECKRKDQNIREINKLAECAHQLEKLTRHLVLFKKHIARIAPHLIADILHQYEGTNLYPKVKIHLNNCIYSLISQCDHHAVSYLRRVLSSASTEMFKIMLDNYRKFYRFTGKV
ncbi:hypothetical protein HHI36_018879 [Cryptolaemus montrouzieri]|uniref:Nucleolar 27S pre-rRNA processing Urb2/Npa2 C-terminal domain-containing protein n=1 Tax=Cryptolaemus montrouzieri TaxID=559131 RepID=A0ABD2P1B6_9CUCU